MRHSTLKIRLYVPDVLHAAQGLMLNDNQSHYLVNVMRCEAGHELAVFNEKGGEFLARLVTPHQKRAVIETVKKLSSPVPTPECHLYMTPLKKEALTYAVEKATECGVTHIHFVVTDYTDVPRINAERLRATALEAAEQCRRYDIPQISEPVALDRFLAQFSEQDILLVAAEDGRGETMNSSNKPAVLHLFIGPEGGFSKAEFLKLSQNAFVKFIDLGPRILRAETAVVVGLSRFL